MMLHWLQQTGQQADRADGRRHHARRRPLRQGRDAQASCPSSRSRPTRRASRACSPSFLKFGAGKTDAIMLDNAEWLTKLNYIEMLRDVGRHFSVNRMLTMDSVKTAARARPGDELHRVQLHDAAGLRLRRAGQTLRLQPADGRLRPVGQHRHRHRSRPAHGHPPALCPDHAAADHRLGRQDGQDRRGRGVAQRGHAVAPTTTGSTGATPRTPTSAASSSCSRTLPMAEIAKLAALQGAEINEAKKVLATEATALLHGRDKAEAAAKTAQETFEQGATSEGLPTVEIAGSRAGGRARRARGLREGGPRQIQRRGAAPDRRRRPARQRRRRVATTAASSRPRDVTRRRHQALARPQAACAAEAGVAGAMGSDPNPPRCRTRARLRVRR